MNIVHISLHNSIKDGGIFFYLTNLLDYQKSIGLNSFWITCRDNNIKIKKSEILKRVKDLSPDIIHIHGLWTIQTRLINDLLKITKNIIIAPHGMLHKNALKKSSNKKKLALFVYERRNLENAFSFHALDKEERRHIRYSFPKMKSFLLGTGIRIPKKKNLNVDFKWLKQIRKNDRIILFLGRLEAQKGIPELLETWLKLKNEAKKYNCWLLIAGFGKFHNKIQNLSLDITNRIIFNGLTLGEEKNFILQLSDAFVLPSRYEGVPISFLEAISYKCLCLVTKECKLRQLKKNNSSIEIHLETTKMKKDLVKFFKLSDEEIKEKTQKAMDYIKAEHDWYKIAKTSERYYKKMITSNIKNAKKPLILMD